MVASVGVITAGRGYDYLTKEVATSKHDYYTGSGEAPGQWAGRAAALLGLSGEVDADDMAVLYGRFVVPATVGGTRLPSGRWEREQVLGRAVSTRVRADGSVLEPIAALDVTFSPSKSVSLLWALSSDLQVRESVVDAHEAAVATALEYLDAHASHTRTGAGGVRRVDSGGFVIAQFRHRTARSTVPGERVGDPQLHSHCAILNRVRGVDGVWRTLDSRAIHRHAHAAGAIYAAELERLLSERLGVSWERPSVRTPMREIVGIPAELRARFSSRRAAVLSTYGRLEGEWRRIHGRSPTRDEAARMRDEATVRSRRRKTGGTVDLHERWRSMTTTDELAAVDAVTTVGAATIGDGGRLVAGSTVLAEKVFAELHQQRACWTRAHLTVEVARWINEPSPLAVEVEVERLAAMCLPLEPDSDVDYAQPDIAKLTSPTIMQAERRVLAALDEREPFTVATVSDPGLGDDQIRAVRAITESRRRVTTIIGPAGAGKTTMLQAAGRSIDYAARDMTVLCLSAAAARVVTEETGMAADTIASWRIGQVDLPVGGVVVVDEASMVPTLVLDELVAATRRAGCRLTLVGDYAQMGAPEAGGLLHDLAAHPATVHLTSVRRFRNEWERTASTRLRNRDTSVIDDYLRHGRLRPIWSDIADVVVVDGWHTDITAGRDTIIVTDTSDLAATISAACQQRLLDTGQLTGPSIGVAADGNPVHVGDLIQTRRNTRELATSDGRRVLNRDVWRIADSTPDGGLVAVHTRAGHAVTITPEYAAADVVLAYATTIAGAQGRTADRGHALVTPQTSAQALYVGMTRGRESNIAHVVCDGHDHQELGLGDRSPGDAFAAAMQRDPDGNLSAHTIAERWHAERPARNAARPPTDNSNKPKPSGASSFAPCRHASSKNSPGSTQQSSEPWHVSAPTQNARRCSGERDRSCLSRRWQPTSSWQLCQRQPNLVQRDRSGRVVCDLPSEIRAAPGRCRERLAQLYRYRYSCCMDVGGTIRDFRTRHGLTQSELGRLSGVPQPVLSAYEHGHRSPTLDTLEAILAVRDETIAVEPAQASQHDRSVARTIEIHRIVLDKLLQDPDHVLEQAEAQLDLLHEVASDRSKPYLDAWRTLLDGPRVELVRVLMSTSEHDVELLKVSPFATLLSDDDRAEVTQRALRRRALAS